MKEPLLPDQTGDDTDAGWGEELGPGDAERLDAERSDVERLEAERPPHHDRA